MWNTFSCIYHFLVQNKVTVSIKKKERDQMKIIMWKVRCSITFAFLFKKIKALNSVFNPCQCFLKIITYLFLFQQLGYIWLTGNYSKARKTMERRIYCKIMKAKYRTVYRLWLVPFVQKQKKNIYCPSPCQGKYLGLWIWFPLWACVWGN